MLMTAVAMLPLYFFLGQLHQVNLIKWVSDVRPRKVSSILVKFCMYLEVDEWCMTVCSMTRSKITAMRPWKSEIRPFSTAISSPIYNGGWQITTDF